MNYIFGMYGIVWTQVLADILMVIVSLIVYKKFEKGLEMQFTTKK